MGDGQATARPRSGITIDPAQLTRMRDLVPLSREGLAIRTGQILFDYGRLTAVLDGREAADARLARALWLALGCDPAGIIGGLPAGLPRNEAALWLRRNAWWRLDLAAVRQRQADRGLDDDALARAAARYWFSRDEVNKIERGERRPKAETLAAFCQILGCKPADLMPGSAPLPDGQTLDRKERNDWYAGLRAFAEERGDDYRYPPKEPGKLGRPKYVPGLREAYAEWLASRDQSATAS